MKRVGSLKFYFAILFAFLLTAILLTVRWASGMQNSEANLLLHAVQKNAQAHHSLEESPHE